MTKPTKLHEIAAQLKLDVSAEFVPFSRSRYAKPRDGQQEPWKSLNWKVTLKRDGRSIMTTDYSAGIGHCPASKNPPKFETSGKVDPYLQRMRITDEIENGKTSRLTHSGSRFALGGAPILPDECDVIHSLVIDADVLNYTNFEDWAENFGYDSDSIKARATYDDCLSIALNLKNAFTSQEFEALQNACQDY
jgi:hypothetical protein